MKIQISNSFCKILEGNEEECALVKEVLTYENDIGAEVGQLIYQRRNAQRYGNKELIKAISAKIKFLEDTRIVCWLRDDEFPTGHLNLVREVLKQGGYGLIKKDVRVKPDPYLILPWNNKPPKPRYYQEEILEACLAAGRGVVEAAVGSGKSLCMTMLIKELRVNTLIIVPSVALGVQLLETLESAFGKSKVQSVSTADIKSKKKLKPIRICTIQSVASLFKTNQLNPLIKDIDMLMCDEFHHAGSESFSQLMKSLDHVYFKYGYTGTFVRQTKILDMWGFLSNVVYKYQAKQAIQEGYLTPLKGLKHVLRGEFSSSYPKEYDKNYCGPVMVQRLKQEIGVIGPHQQILILVNRKDKAGKVFHEYLSRSGIDVSYISGDDKKEVINQTIQDFNDEKIKILIGSSVLGEGVDIRSSSHLFMCQGGKSEVVIVQAIGRCVRLFPGKPFATVHDFEFEGTKFMSKHSKRREEIIKANFDLEFELKT